MTNNNEGKKTSSRVEQILKNKQAQEALKKEAEQKVENEAEIEIEDNNGDVDESAKKIADLEKVVADLNNKLLQNVSLA